MMLTWQLLNRIILAKRRWLHFIWHKDFPSIWLIHKYCLTEMLDVQTGTYERAVHRLRDRNEGS